MVSAELAVAMPALVLVLLTALLGLGLAVDQVRCTDAARAAARSAARGDPPAESIGIARRMAPTGATVQVGRSGALARVVVIAPSRGGGLAPGLPRASATAIGQVEQVVTP